MADLAAHGWCKDDGPKDSPASYSCVFRLSEIGGTDDRWVYSRNEYSVDLNYTPETRVLSVRLSLANVANAPNILIAEFKNTYEYNPTTAGFSIDIEKTVEQGGTAAPGKEDFTFLLRDADGNTPADYGITITLATRFQLTAREPLKELLQVSLT